MPVSWNIPLVAVSVLVAIAGSFTALTHAQRMRKSSGRAAVLWMVAGGITLGMAIWSMHFIGMLAFHLPIPLAYDPALTILSFLPAVVAALLGFRLLREPVIGNGRLFADGLLMGAGISVMHYTGMAALEMSPPIGYDTRIVVLSVVIAVVASWGALLMMYQGERIKLPPWPRFLLGAVIMGLAISGMHYTAMQGLDIQPGSVCMEGIARIEPGILALLVSIVSIFWFGGGLLAALFDQRLAQQNAQALAELEQAHAEFQQHAAEYAAEITRSLSESEERLSMTLRCAPDAVFICEKDGRIIYVNDNVVDQLGYSREELLAMTVYDLVPLDWRERYRHGASQMLANNERHVLEIRLVRKDGRKIPMELNAVLLPDGHVYGSCRDITERKEASRALKHSEMRLRTLFESTSDAVMLLDEKGFFDCNQATLRMFGCASKEEFCSKHPADVSPPEQPGGMDSMTLAMQRIAAALEQGSNRFEWMHMRVDTGAVFPAEVLLNAMELDGRRVLQATVRDITERKEAEQRIHQLAFYDPLTELPNRRLFQDRLQQAFSSSMRSGKYGAVLALDLDNFKTLNDTKGHDYGDMLLVEVARRLEGCVRDGDTVARVGGDEFVVVLEELNAIMSDAATQAELVAEKVRSVLSEVYVLNSYQHHSTPSIGIVLFRGHQDTLDELLKHADTAMYQAKAAGRDAIRFYDPEMQAALEARTELEGELRRAVEERQFELFYQVQVDSLRRPLGAEVLLRWRHPGRGLVSPAQFIPLLEETSQILPVGEWVLQSACAQLKAWQHDAHTRDLVLAVNVSARQFRQKNFVLQVQRALQESSARPSLLKLELTESMVLEDVDGTIAKMRELKLLGVGFSLDDFGTGYSSLQYLKRLPLDQIKIDRSFVRDIASDPNDAAIVQTIIAMSDALGLDVIAEGVETVAQSEFLDRHGCHNFQGYLFGKPVPLAEFEASLGKSSG